MRSVMCIYKRSDLANLRYIYIINVHFYEARINMGICKAGWMPSMFMCIQDAFLCVHCCHKVLMVQPIRLMRMQFIQPETPSLTSFTNWLVTALTVKHDDCPVHVITASNQ